MIDLILTLNLDLIDPLYFSARGKFRNLPEIRPEAKAEV